MTLKTHCLFFSHPICLSVSHPKTFRLHHAFSPETLRPYSPPLSVQWLTPPLGGLWTQKSGCPSGFPWDTEPYWRPILASGLWPGSPHCRTVSFTAVYPLQCPLFAVPLLCPALLTVPPVLPLLAYSSSFTECSEAQTQKAPRPWHPPSCFPLAGSCSSSPPARLPSQPVVQPGSGVLTGHGVTPSACHCSQQLPPDPPTTMKSLPDTLPLCIPHSAFGLCNSLVFICLSQKQVNIEMSRK